MKESQTPSQNSGGKSKEDWILERGWYLMMMDGDHATDPHRYFEQAEKEYKEKHG